MQKSQSLPLEVVQGIYPNSLIVNDSHEIIFTSGISEAILLPGNHKNLQYSLLPVLKPFIIKLLEGAKQSKKAQELKSIIVDWKSETVCLDLTISCFETQSKKNTYFIFSLDPIYEREQNLSYDSKKEIFLDEIQSINFVGSFYHELESKMTYVSEKVYDILDLTSDQAINIFEDSEFFDKEDRQKLKSNLANLKISGGFEDTFIITTHLNRYKSIKLRVKPVFDASNERLVAYKGAIKDITNEVYNEERIKFALSCTQIGFWDWDIVSKDLEFDDKMLELYGIGKNYYSNLFEYWLSSLLPEDRAKTEFALQEAVVGNKEYNLYFRIKTPAGIIKSIHGTGKVLRDKQGVPIRMIGANIDVTEVIAKDSNLRDQQRIASQSARLAQLGELSAGLGHEINNPLTICMSSLSLLQRGLSGKELDGKVKRNIEILEKGLQRINTLVDTLRSYVSTTQEDKIEIFDVNEVIKDTQFMVENLVNKAKVEFQLDLCSEFFIEGNSTKMGQVLMNLISNSIYAVENSSEKLVCISTYIESNVGHIRFDDTGSGIAEEIQNKIFELFYTTKDKFRGTGIGLSLSQDIISNLGGKLELVSPKLNGASFLITLPLAPKKR